MSASGHDNGRRRMRSYVRDEKTTVFWGIIGLAAVVALAVLYLYWETGEKFPAGSNPSSQTTQQSTAPGDTGQGSGSSSASPGNPQTTTGSPPSR